MKLASSAIQAVLASSQYFVADLFTFNLVNGTVLRYTDSDAPLTVSGQTYLTGLTIKRGSFKQERGIKAQSLQLTIAPQADSYASTNLGSVPFLQAVRLALFDSCSIVWSKFIADAPQSTALGSVPWFQGIVDNATAGRATAVFTCESNAMLLNMQMPRNLYQAGCVHTLGDGGCTVVLANYTNTGGVVVTNVNSVTNNDITTNLGGSFTFTGTTTNGSPNITAISAITGSGLFGGATVTGTGIVASTTLKNYSAGTAVMTKNATASGTITVTYTYPDDVYSLGIITFTSGGNSGVSRTIRRFLNASGEVQFVNTPPNLMLPGDTFKIITGCDKKFNTCSVRFGNLAHNRSMPYVPIPETLYSGGTSSSQVDNSRGRQGGTDGSIPGSNSVPRGYQR